MKPKVMFLNHSGKLPIRRMIQLERDFVVGCHGADWSYGLIRSLWKLRGWDVIVCQTVYHAFLASLCVPETPLIVENHGDLDLRNQVIARWMVRRAWALRSVSAWTARQFDKHFRPDGHWVYHRRFPAWTDEDVFWEARGLYEKSSLFHVLYAGGKKDHKGCGLASELGFKIPVAHVWGVSQIELARAMAKAHVVIVPSKREGLGLVALEAFMAGTPVVASNVGGLREIVRHGQTGLIVRSDRVDAWLEAIRMLEKNPGLARRFVSNAGEFVKGYWTKNKQREGMKALVAEVIRLRWKRI